MRVIDADIVARLESGELRVFMLLEFGVGMGHHFTDCDVPILSDGDLYTPLGFAPQPIGYSTAQIVDQAQIRIDNVNQQLMSDFVGKTPQGSEVVLSLVVITTELADEGDRHILTEAGDILTTENNYNIDWDVIDLPGYQPSDKVVLFKGYVDEWQLSEGNITVTVATQFTRWTQKTLSLHSVSCRWKEYKGIECGYTGSMVKCNRSYSACDARGNTDNFGGFRFLPSIEDKQIWWGPTPEAD